MQKEDSDMEIDLNEMAPDPSRPANWRFAVQVLSDSGTRCLVHVMVDDKARDRCKAEVAGLNDDVIKALYRQQLQVWFNEVSRVAARNRLQPSTWYSSWTAIGNT